MLFGVGRNNGRLGIQRQRGSYNIDFSVSKESQAEFAPLAEKLTYCTCLLLLEIKQAGILFEIGISFIFKEQQMTRITSLNTTLKALENQNAPQQQHKRAAKRDF